MAESRILRFGMQLTAIGLLASVLPLGHAQTTSDLLPVPVPVSLQGQRLDGQLHGFVLNRTITVVGFDFYQYFSAEWRAREKSDQYSIAIIERPTAIRGSEIWVEYRNQRVFRTFLSSTRSRVRDISERAVGIVYDAVVDMDLQQLLYQDQDLAKEELQ